MAKYLKISYVTSNSNQALLKCIAYIGKYSYENDICNTNTVNLQKGINYLARKCRTSKTSIRKMIFAKKYNGYSAMQWSFDKRKYSKVYRYILGKIISVKFGNKEEALELLHNLYIETQTHKNGIEKIISDVIVFEQKNLLEWASNKNQYDQDVIDRILAIYNECDRKYHNIL